MNPAVINWSLLALLIVIWGTGFAFISVALQAFTPVGVAFCRILMAALLITSLVYLRGEKLPADRHSWGVFFWLALFGNAAPFLLIATGQLSVSSGMTGLLMAIMPLFTLILAHYFVAGETLNRFKLLGFALGLLGVYLVVNHSLGDSATSIAGALMVLTAAGCYAINTVLARRLLRHTMLVSSAGVLILASLMLLPVLLWQGLLHHGAELTKAAMLALLWVGVGPTALATVVYFTVIARAGPSFLANINFFIPVVAYFTGMMALHEPIDRYSLLAIPLILSGIAISRIGRPRG